MEDRGGRLELMLPYATLEPVRELLLQMFMGEKFGRDSIWENHLATELWFTEVEVDAVLDEIYLPLSDVMNWQVGTQIQLQTKPEDDIMLRCGMVPLFKASMGRKSGKVAVRVSERLMG
jgi:flagellar motor switch protein FliM